MNLGALALLVFDERCTLPAGVPDVSGTPAQLLALLELACVHRLEHLLDAPDAVIVIVRVDCRHCAPVAPCAEIHITGWIERNADTEAVVHVHAQDSREQVCEGRIHVAIMRRSDVATAIDRKRHAQLRHELFAPRDA
ncbi:MAG TPA: hotdog domain-containing protein [Casimicrobiaceae bacterium]|nr:hotdog domain-containing protein [Casimicrobiaceae bacterium]